MRQATALAMHRDRIVREITNTVRLVLADHQVTVSTQQFRQGMRELAAMAGIARENFNRILADWKRRKLVSRFSGYYCLENKALLQTEAEL